MPWANGVGGAAHLDPFAAHENVAAGHAQCGRKHLDQRRLSGAVVSEQADNLLTPDPEVHAVERLDAAEELVDVLHPNQVIGGQVLRHLRSRPRVAPAFEPGMQRHHAEDDGANEDM
jgi:hypothetical protein